MSTNQRFVEAAPSDVFAVLTDGWLFPSWVVGASRIRDVDLAWPSVGATIAHSFGSLAARHRRHDDDPRVATRRARRVPGAWLAPR